MLHVSACASQMVSCQANNANAIKAAYHVAAVEQSDQQELRRPLSATVSGESEGTVGVMNANISQGSAGARRRGLKIHVWSKHASISPPSGLNPHRGSETFSCNVAVQTCSL